MVRASSGYAVLRRKRILGILAALNKKKSFAEQYLQGWLKSSGPP